MGQRLRGSNPDAVRTAEAPQPEPIHIGGPMQHLDGSLHFGAAPFIAGVRPGYSPAISVCQTGRIGLL
jgi:hypothetical protein